MKPTGRCCFISYIVSVPEESPGFSETMLGCGYTCGLWAQRAGCSHVLLGEVVMGIELLCPSPPCDLRNTQPGPASCGGAATAAAELSCCDVIIESL